MARAPVEATLDQKVRPKLFDNIHLRGDGNTFLSHVAEMSSARQEPPRHLAPLSTPLSPTPFQQLSILMPHRTKSLGVHPVGKTTG